VKETLKVVIELLAAIPSIVWGFIGLMMLGPIVKEIFSTPLQPVWAIISRLLVGGILAAIFVPLGSRLLWNKTSTAVSATISWTAVAIIFLGSHLAIKWLAPSLHAPLSTAWGHIMVTLHLANVEGGTAQGTNLLTGGIILGLMSVPVIVSLSEDALRAVPDSFREAALALGANPWETVRRVLFPAARNGLLAACLLGMGRAVGETMAVLLATGHNLRIPHSLTDPVRTMTATIAAEMGETVQGGEHYRVLFILGIVLFVITCGINVASDLIIKGVKKANKA
jgi:phosphate transport system permease protein